MLHQDLIPEWICVIHKLNCNVLRRFYHIFLIFLIIEPINLLQLMDQKLSMKQYFQLNLVKFDHHHLLV